MKRLIAVFAMLVMVGCAAQQPKVGDLMEGAEATGADEKLTELSTLGNLTVDDIMYAVDDPSGGTPTSYSVTTAVVYKVPHFKDGSADGNIQALDDTTSVGSDGDPLVLTAGEVSGTIVSNLGAAGALYFLLPAAAIGYSVLFNADAAQNVFVKPPSGTDIYWKDYDDTGFASGGNDKDVQCSTSIAIGDRTICHTRKVASTIEWFCSSDVDACIIEP